MWCKHICIHDIVIKVMYKYICICICIYTYIYIYIYMHSQQLSVWKRRWTHLFSFGSRVTPIALNQGLVRGSPCFCNVYIYICTNNVYNRIYIYILYDIMFSLYTFDTVIKNNRCTILSTCSLRCPKRPGPRTASSDRSTAIFIKGWTRWPRDPVRLGQKSLGVQTGWNGWYLYGIYMVFIWYLYGIIWY